MKLKCFIAMSLAVFLMLMTVAAYAATGVGIEFSVGSAYTMSGETVRIPVHAEVNEGFAAFTLDITYDPEVIEPVSAVKGGILDGIFIYNTDYSENTVRLTYAGAVNTETSGVVCELEFNAVADCDDISPLELKIDYLANEQYIDVIGSAENGALGVSVFSWTPIFCQAMYADKEQEILTAELSNLSSESIEDLNIYIALYDPNDILISLYNTKTEFSSNEMNKAVKFEYGETSFTKAAVYVWKGSMTPYMMTMKELI